MDKGDMELVAWKMVRNKRSAGRMVRHIAIAWSVPHRDELVKQKWAVTQDLYATPIDDEEEAL